MPFSGGAFTLSQDFIADQAAGPPASYITASKMDNVLEDMADGLEACLHRLGQNQIGADINWGGFKITNLGAAAAGTDVPRARQVAEGVLVFCGATTGSANAYAVTATYITSVQNGTRLLIRPNHQNSGASTLAVNGGAAIDIRDVNDAALASGVIVADRFYEVFYSSATGHWHLYLSLINSDIGVSVQAYDAQLASLAALASVGNLTAIAGLTSAADRAPYFTGSEAAALATLTSYGRTVMALASASALRSNLDVPRVPSGSITTWQQTSAPTGWTKITTHNDKALRVVSGTASSGGSTAFSSVLASRTILQANLPSVNLSKTLALVSGAITNGASLISGSINTDVATGTAKTFLTPSGLSTVGISVTTPTVDGTISLGGSGTAMDFAVQYVDIILASRDSE